MEKVHTSITKIAAMLTLSSLAGCASLSMPHFGSTNSQPAIVTQNNPQQEWSGPNQVVWEKLHRFSSAELTEQLKTTSDAIQQGWLNLVLISKRYSTNTPQLVHALIAWRAANPQHPANTILPSDDELQAILTTPEPQHIAVMLPESNTYQRSGKTVKEGFLNAYYANKSKNPNQTVKFYDTAQSVNLALLYQQTGAEGADFTVGPLLKPNVQQVMDGTAFNHPTLALNYTDSGMLPKNLYQFGLLPEDEVIQIADKAREAGLSKALIIAPNNPLGQRLVTALSGRWQQLGGQVQDSLRYDNNTNFNQTIAQLLHVDISADKKLMSTENNKAVLSQQRRQDFNVIFIVANPQQGKIIIPLLKYYYAGDVPVYASSAIFSGRFNPTRDADLTGITVCDIPSNIRNSGQAVHQDRLYAVGQDAYTITKVLNRMLVLPNFPVYGKTGALTLGANHQIHRRLPCIVLGNNG